MKKNLIFLSLIVALFGCNNYIQICEVKTINEKLDDKNNIVYENDTLKITYTFWSNGGVLGCSIYNKIDKPIYIDWRNSAFIFNGDKVNYWVDEMQTNSNSNSGTYLYKQQNPFFPSLITNTATSSTTTKPERITFIPPKSNYYRYQFALTNHPFYLLKIGGFSDSIFKSDKINGIAYDEKLDRSFNHENSPFKFRNFIAYSLTENSASFSFIDNEFYLSKISEFYTKNNNDYTNYLLNKYQNNTTFYYKLGTYSTAHKGYYHK